MWELRKIMSALQVEVLWTITMEFIMKNSLTDIFGYHFEKDGVIEYTDYQFDFGYQRFIFEKKSFDGNHISFKKYVRYQDPPFLWRQ